VSFLVFDAIADMRFRSHFGAPCLKHRPTILKCRITAVSVLGEIVGQALATEAIAECIRIGGVWETESNIELVGFVPIPTAKDWDAPFTVERIKL
jgi:hypothetical protein